MLEFNQSQSLGKVMWLMRLVKFQQRVKFYAGILFIRLGPSRSTSSILLAPKIYLAPKVRKVFFSFGLQNSKTHFLADYFIFFLFLADSGPFDKKFFHKAYFHSSAKTFDRIASNWPLLRVKIKSELYKFSKNESYQAILCWITCKNYS